MKIAAIGSCMSNLTIARLKAYGFEQTLSVHHNRSDAFVNFFIDKTAPQIPYALLEQKFIYKPEYEDEARKIFRNQYIEGLGFHDLMARKETLKTDFFEQITHVPHDVILMDNFMDLASKMAIWQNNPDFAKSPLFFNFGFFENETDLLKEFDYSYDYLSGEMSARYQHRLYKWLRRMQPGAKIFFLAYHSCSSRNNPRRYKAARDFYKKFADLTRFDDIYLVPPLTVAPELTKGEEDWPHFQDKVYDALAGFVYLHTVGGWGRPFHSFSLPN